MKKRFAANPNFFKQNTGGGVGDGDFVVGADRLPPPQQAAATGQANKGQAAVNGNTQDIPAQGGSRNLVGCYKRAKQNGIFNMQNA